jgi:hypothetical protein
MNQEDRIRLERQYALLSDTQIIQLIADGPQAYVDGVYRLLEAEAARRGLAVQYPPVKRTPVQTEGVHETPSAETAYIEVAVINSARDKAALQASLEGADIAFTFLPMHILTERELPVALAVEQTRLDDMIRALEGFVPEASFLLWK